ncbi:MAG: PH domain-containing protein [Taibaiella sp.]|nr:PH domain-containing protein [Taibaiella sp.]
MSQPKDIDFNQEQHQSPTGMFIEFFFLMRKFFRTSSVLVIYLLLKLEWQYYVYIGLGMLFLIGVTGFFAYLSFRNTLFYIDKLHQEFVLQRGIINKEKHVIQLDKILQVNINQNFWQRIFDVYAVEIETAGSKKTEAKIKALNQDIAFSLKNALLERTSSNPESGIDMAEQGEDRSREIVNEKIKISSGQIILYAFTADYIRSFLVMMGIIFSFYSRIREYFENFRQSVDEWENAALSYFETHSIPLAIGLLFMLSILVNAIRNIITYYGLQIKPEKSSSWISYGLISRHNTLLQNNRIQTFSITTQWIQKILGLYKVRVTQISSDIQADKKAKVNIVGLKKEQVQQLFEQIYQESFPGFRQRFTADNRLAILPVLLYILLPILITATIGYWQILPVYLYAAAAAFLILMGFLIRRYVRTYCLYLQDEYLMLEYKMWTEKKTILRIKDIQSVRIQQYAWHRSLGLGHITFQTAGGDIHFMYGEMKMLQQLADWVLYRIESNQANVPFLYSKETEPDLAHRM